jgi:hypothetical protein
MYDHAFTLFSRARKTKTTKLWHVLDVVFFILWVSDNHVEESQCHRDRSRLLEGKRRATFKGHAYTSTSSTVSQNQRVTNSLNFHQPRVEYWLWDFCSRDGITRGVCTDIHSYDKLWKQLGLHRWPIPLKRRQMKLKEPNQTKPNRSIKCFGWFACTKR